MSAPPQPPSLPPLAELVPLPRTQLGPFLILGLDKDADIETVESAWAKRLIWARKEQTRAPLEDINWARETMKEPARRLQADAGSLNIDTTGGFLARLLAPPQAAGDLGRPVDVEKDLTSFRPQTPLPDCAGLHASLPEPRIPRDVPAVASILSELVQQPVDPWQVFDDRD